MDERVKTTITAANEDMLKEDAVSRVCVWALLLVLKAFIIKTETLQ